MEKQMKGKLTVELSAIERQLKHEIAQRTAAEEALKKSEQHYSVLLEQSRDLQEQLRHLSHQVLSAQVLSNAIREVQKGSAFFRPVISKRLHDHDKKSPDAAKLFKKRGVGLSSREMEVLQMIAEGKANKQIAAELCISRKTVEKHRQHLMDKLNIHNIAGLTRYAIATGTMG
jgi:DNA-binding NarL/FixJ family response regulator